MSSFGSVNVYCTYEMKLFWWKQHSTPNVNQKDFPVTSRCTWWTQRMYQSLAAPPPSCTPSPSSTSTITPMWSWRSTRTWWCGPVAATDNQGPWLAGKGLQLDLQTPAPCPDVHPDRSGSIILAVSKHPTNSKICLVGTSDKVTPYGWHLEATSPHFGASSGCGVFVSWVCRWMTVCVFVGKRECFSLYIMWLWRCVYECLRGYCTFSPAERARTKLNGYGTSPCAAFFSSLTKRKISVDRFSEERCDSDRWQTSHHPWGIILSTISDIIFSAVNPDHVLLNKWHVGVSWFIFPSSFQQFFLLKPYLPS